MLRKKQLKTKKMTYKIIKEAVIKAKTGAGMATIIIENSLSQKELKELYDKGYTEFIEKTSANNSSKIESPEAITTEEKNIGKVIIPGSKECIPCQKKNKK